MLKTQRNALRIQDNLVYLWPILTKTINNKQINYETCFSFRHGSIAAIGYWLTSPDCKDIYLEPDPRWQGTDGVLPSTDS